MPQHCTDLYIVCNICNRVDRLIPSADVYMHIYTGFIAWRFSLIFALTACVRAAFMQARSREKALKRIDIRPACSSSRADKEKADSALTHTHSEIYQ